MNTKTIVMIAAIGAIGAFAIVLAAMMGIGQIADTKPMIRASLAVAEKHKVREVTLSIVPPAGVSRTIRLGYTTSVLAPSGDAEREEMETIAKFAFEQVNKVELETLRKHERDERGPIRKVEVRRTWRSDRGCFKRSDQAMHEWIPPLPPPPERR